MSEGLAILKKLKEQHAQQERRIEQQKIVTLRRVQVQEKRPAIAQLRIEFPKSVSPPMQVVSYFEQRKRSYPIDAPVHRIFMDGTHTFVIEIHSCKMMYSWIESFIHSFMDDFGRYGRGFNTKMCGSWDSYNEREHY